MIFIVLIDISAIKSYKLNFNSHLSDQSCKAGIQSFLKGLVIIFSKYMFI